MTRLDPIVGAAEVKRTATLLRDARSIRRLPRQPTRSSREQAQLRRAREAVRRVR